MPTEDAKFSTRMAWQGISHTHSGSHKPAWHRTSLAPAARYSR